MKKQTSIPKGQSKYCEGCGKIIHKEAKQCPHCGYQKASDNKALAIIGLVVNIFLLPGLGTIIGGETTKGITQLIALFVGVILIIVLIGIPIVLGVWIWSIISSIQQLAKQ